LKISHILLIALLTFGLASCGEDDPVVNPNEINQPANYTFERDGISTVSFSGQTTRIRMAEELITAMTNVDNSAAHLLEMYANQTASGDDANPFAYVSLNESTKSIKSKVAASADFFSSNTAESAQIKADFERWINAQVNEVFPNRNESATAGSAGQIADGSTARYISAKGLEYNQVVNKALIGGLMVDQMINNYLSKAVLDAGDNRAQNEAGIVEEGTAYTSMEHKWDEAFGYLYGVNTEELDGEIFLQKSLYRVDEDNDFQGIAKEVYEALKLGRAAIVAGAYDIRDDQAEIIRGLVSKVIAIRAVYYLQQGKNALALSDFGGVFHDLSAGYGFIHSLRYTRSSNSDNGLFTSAEVNGFLDQLMTGNGFWDVSSETLESISEGIADKFDFTVDQAGS